VLAAGDAPFAEIGGAEQRRIWIPLSDVPAHAHKAFVAGQDNRFFAQMGSTSRASEHFSKRGGRRLDPHAGKICLCRRRHVRAQAGIKFR